MNYAFVEKNQSSFKTGIDKPVKITLQNEQRQPVNLTGATVKVRIASTSQLLLEKAISISDATKGIVQLSFTTNEDLDSGSYDMELEVTYSNGTKEVFPDSSYLKIKVLKALERRENTFEVSSDLTRLRGDLETLKTTASTNATNAKTQADYAKAQGDFAKSKADQMVSLGTPLDKTVSRNKLDDDLQQQVTQAWIDDSVVYAIVDKENRCIFSIDKEGKTKIHSLQLSDNSLKETALQGVETVDSYVTGVMWGIIDAQGRMSDLTIDETGRIPQRIIDDWKNRMNLNTYASTAYVDGKVENNLKPISAWGDSLTGGAAGVASNKLWAGLLPALTGRTVNNMGVGGETSATISMRQGASHVTVNNITIPADNTTPVLVADQATNPFKDNWGKTVTPLKQQQAGVNPVTIDGIEGTLTIVDPSLSTSKWYFTRTTPGTQKIINRPTPIITNASRIRRDDIMIIFMGQNGGYSSDTELVQQIRRMIEFNNAVKKEYLVLGLTTGAKTERATLEDLMSHEFGRRFVNLRDYLSTYGVYDVNITPTQTDLDYMALGKVPPSLLATSLGGSNANDYVHYNEYGHQVIANVVYKRLTELKII